MDRGKDHIDNVSCNVKNCVHNNHQNACTAKQIKVGPTSAVTMEDTVCATYDPQSDWDSVHW